MFVLDTNVISELRKARSGRANPAVVAWANEVPGSALYLSVITVMELELGVRLKERRDVRQARALEKWLARTLDSFANRLLPIDARIARHCASLHVPDPRAERDAFIAATAVVHGCTVVTRNESDFVGTGAVLLNPWKT